MASATILPNSPSAGMTPFQRKLQGSRPTNAPADTSSTIAPRVLTYGELMGRDRNQRTEYSNRNTGIRKATMPNNCKTRSLVTAPIIPTQLWVGRLTSGVAAVLSDPSSGEYDTRARARKAATTRTRKPISSLSRLLVVGVNARARTVILALERCADLGRF